MDDIYGILYLLAAGVTIYAIHQYTTNIEQFINDTDEVVEIVEVTDPVVEIVDGIDLMDIINYIDYFIDADAYLIWYGLCVVPTFCYYTYLYIDFL